MQEKIRSRKRGTMWTVTKTDGADLNMIRVLIRKMDLSELLELSEYIDKLIHGEKSSLPVSARARHIIALMTKIDSAPEFKKVISELNAQIIIKNRDSVNKENAKKTYMEFMKAE